MLVSAFIADGPPSRIIQETVDGRLRMIMLLPVMEELQRTLTEKFGFEASKWQRVEALLKSLSTGAIPRPEGQVEAVTGDSADDVILACAVEAKVDVLVSGDRKHLLPVESYHGVRIETPQVVLARHKGS